MPKKIERKFEAEYGKRKGRLIFYKWRSKHKHQLMGLGSGKIIMKAHINPKKVRLLGIGGKR